jgi:hypothetical protein
MIQGRVSAMILVRDAKRVHMHPVWNASISKKFFTSELMERLP